jgi:hypothetical protein
MSIVNATGFEIAIPEMDISRSRTIQTVGMNSAGMAPVNQNEAVGFRSLRVK